MKQRSKQELLHNIACFEAMKRDIQNDVGMRGKVVYWRSHIEWGKTLIEQEHLSANDVKEMYQYILKNDLVDFPEERKEEIRNLMKEKKCDIIIRVMLPEKQKRKDMINSTIHELEYYNTNISVNYALLASEYLIRKKGFAKKRLERVLISVYYLDKLDAYDMMRYRDELYEKRGIFIDIGVDEIPDGAEII